MGGAVWTWTGPCEYVAAMGRNFVVAAWERGRHRERRLRQVEADTAEHAVITVASSGSAENQEVVYEAWPSETPASNLRMVLQHRDGSLSAEA
jgi:predicted oxidoreductase